MNMVLPVCCSDRTLTIAQRLLKQHINGVQGVSSCCIRTDNLFGSLCEKALRHNKTPVTFRRHNALSVGKSSATLQKKKKKGSKMGIKVIFTLQHCWH